MYNEQMKLELKNEKKRSSWLFPESSSNTVDIKY